MNTALTTPSTLPDVTTPEQEDAVILSATSLDKPARVPGNAPAGDTRAWSLGGMVD